MCDVVVVMLDEVKADCAMKVQRAGTVTVGLDAASRAAIIITTRWSMTRKEQCQIRILLQGKSLTVESVPSKADRSKFARRFFKAWRFWEVCVV